MSAEIALSLGIEYFPNPLRGIPVSSGKVYIGDADTDPTVEGNRITVTVQEEDGTRVPIAPAAQPLRTGAGGVILYNGAPVSVLVALDSISSYAIRVDDQNDVQVFYNPSVISGTNTDYVLKSGDTMVGQLKGITPVAAEDLTRKDYVDAAIAAYMLSNVYPIGSYFIGANPSAVIGGSWAQIPDATFLMNTTSAEADGGINDQTLTVDQMPAHDHGGGDHDHSYWSNWNGTTDGSGNDIGIMGSSGINGLVNHRQNHRTDVENSVIPNEGGGQTFDNRPKFKSVTIWQRIA